MTEPEAAAPGDQPLSPAVTRVALAVPEALEGERLDRAVSMLIDCSRSRAAALIASGAVTVNGFTITKVSHRLVPGDRLEFESEAPDEGDAVRPQADVAFTVVHEDADLIVVDKPAGLVVHPGAGNPAGTLVNGLVHRYPELLTVGDPARPGIVHRLDSGTSGLMVVARSEQAYRNLVEQLARRTVSRTYTALVLGHLEHSRGVIDAPIGRSRRDPLKMAVTSDGREARTHFEVERTFDEPLALSLLTCRLETGRTHQIRVHLASLGHPVLGDERYGGARGRLPLARPFLHARALGLVHPVSGEELEFSSALPPDLSALLGGLG